MRGKMDKRVSIEGMVLFIAGLVVFILNKVVNGTYANKITVLAFLLFIIGIILMWIEGVESEDDKDKDYTGSPVYSFHNYGE